MSKRWLEREGPRWVQEQMITHDQYERIRGLYGKPGKSFSAGLLPVLGGVLAGLGVLSLVAANWQSLPELFRVLLLCAAMAGAYAGGGQLLRRGASGLGIALISIGLFLFGAGIILIGQMFHMIAYSALSLVVWGAAGAALSYVYRSRYLSLISLAIATAAQWYSMESLSSFSYAAFALLVLGMGTVAYRLKDALVTAVWGLGTATQSILFTVWLELPLGWFFIPLLLLYAAGDHVDSSAQRSAIQSVPLGAAFVIHLIVAALHEAYTTVWQSIDAELYMYAPMLAGLLLLSWYGKQKRGALRSAFGWILFAPFYELPGETGWWATLAAMFLFSLYVLTEGHKEHREELVRTGTVLFLSVTMVAYFTLTWDFINKGAFFLIGGVLLLAVSWILNRTGKTAVRSSTEDGGNRE